MKAMTGLANGLAAATLLCATFGMEMPAAQAAAAGSTPAGAPVGAPTTNPPSPTWQALPHGGLNGIVQALAVNGSDLYVGGFFTETADGAVQNLNGIALLHNGAWQALPDGGLQGGVNALAVLGGDVYAGGYFTETAHGALGNLNYVARLSSDGWHPLADGGLNSDVRGLAVHGSDLYVGGFFSETAHGATQNLFAIARYSNGAWDPLPDNGLISPIEVEIHCCWVQAFAFNGSDLAAVGAFLATNDNTVQNLNGVALLSGGTTWSATPHQGLDNIGISPAVANGAAYLGSDLYVAGTFTDTEDGQVTGLNTMAVLHNGAWTPAPNNGLEDPYFARHGGGFALAARGSGLYVGGTFTGTADGAVQNLNSIAQLSHGAWQALPNGGLRTTSSAEGVDAIAFGSDTLFAGGFFTETADGAVQNLGNIAMLAVPPLPAEKNLYLPLVTR